MKQRKAAHRKQGRAAEDLVDAETHLVWVDNVIEAGAGAYLVFFRSCPYTRPSQLHLEPSRSKQGDNRHMKTGRIAEGDLVGGQTHLVGIVIVSEASTGADVAIFRSCFCSALFCPLQLHFEPPCFQQGHNRHMKNGRVAGGDLADGQTHLVGVVIVREASTGADVAFFRSCFCNGRIRYEWPHEVTGG